MRGAKFSNIMGRESHISQRALFLKQSDCNEVEDIFINESFHLCISKVSVAVLCYMPFLTDTEDRIGQGSISMLVVCVGGDEQPWDYLSTSARR